MGGCGLVVGSVVSRLSNADASFRFTAIAAVTFGNSTGLPITLLSVVYSTAPASSPISNMDPLLFLSVYLVMYPVLQWSVGAWLLTPRPQPDVTPRATVALHRSDSSFAEEKLAVLFTPEKPIYTLMPAGWEAVGDAPAQQSTGSQSWTARGPSQETDSETHIAGPRTWHSLTAAPPNGTEIALTGRAVVRDTLSTALSVHTKLAQIPSEAEIFGGSSCIPDTDGNSRENLLNAQSPLSPPEVLRPPVAAVTRVPRRKKLITAFQRIFPPPVLGALFGWMALRRIVQDRHGCCAHEHVDLGEFHCEKTESRGHFARRGYLCRLCEDGCDAHHWSLRWLHSESFPGCAWAHRSLVLPGSHDSNSHADCQQRHGNG